MKNSKGGKLIGQGSYGCVFSPPLLCDKDTKRKNGVGKIFSESDVAQEEIQELENIKVIDPNGNFTIQMDAFCEVPKRNIKTEDDFSKCSKKKKGILTEYDQIIFKEEGLDLLNFSNKSEYKFSDILDGFINIAKGLLSLEKHNTCHRDIKPANIVIVNSSSELKLIDFGLNCTYTRIYDNMSYNILSHDFKYYPLEFDVYCELLMEEQDTPFNTLFKKYLKLSKPFQQIGININNLETQFLAFKKKLSESDNKDIYQFFTEASKNKIDVFSLGISMLELYTSENSNINDLNDRQKALINTVISNAINFNPFDRCTPQKLYDQLKKIKSAKEIKNYRIKDSKSAPSTKTKISNSKIPSKMECVNQYTIKELQKEARKLKRVNHTSAPLKKHTKYINSVS